MVHVRKVLFWVHLIAGCLAGAVVLIMSLTGVLLTYEQQIVRWAERQYQSSPTASGALPVEALLAKLRQQGVAASSVAIKANERAPVEATVSQGRVVFVDAYTGQVLGQGSASVRGFFRTVTDWHRWLATAPSNRATGRAITGASNLLFFGIILTGIVLWMPRQWTWQHVRPSIAFRRRLQGKARDFNWHNVLGFWCSVPLLLVVSGALVISYPWATNLVYRLTGTEPPKSSGPGPQAPGRREEELVGYSGLDRALARAKQQVPEWQVVSLRLPPAGAKEIPVTVDLVDRRGRPDQRVLMTVDRATAELVKTESFDSYNNGRKVRAWLRWIHTGEAGGILGQTIAGVASAGAAVLVWTGLALAWRRFRAWRSRRGRRTLEAEPVARNSRS